MQTVQAADVPKVRSICYVDAEQLRKGRFEVAIRAIRDVYVTHFTQSYRHENIVDATVDFGSVFPFDLTKLDKIPENVDKVAFYIRESNDSADELVGLFVSN